MIRPFLADIKVQIKDILGVDVPFSPLHFLLHIPPLPVSHYECDQAFTPSVLEASSYPKPRGMDTKGVGD